MLREQDQAHQERGLQLAAAHALGLQVPCDPILNLGCDLIPNQGRAQQQDRITVGQSLLYGQGQRVKSEIITRTTAVQDPKTDLVIQDPHRRGQGLQEFQGHLQFQDLAVDQCDHQEADHQAQDEADVCKKSNSSILII